MAEWSGSVLVMMVFWEAYEKVCVFAACTEICLQLWLLLEMLTSLCR